ncbi:intraflagellar transport protein 81 homolog isoform X4 [Bacillus rossius redtenbacheri]
MFVSTLWSGPRLFSTLICCSFQVQFSHTAYIKTYKMSEELKFIVSELNSSLGKNFNLISFDSLNSEQLLQILTDVLAEIDASNKVDIRGEEPEQTTVRILEMLRVLKYKPSAEISPTTFRQGLVQADKSIIHSILEWLFRNMKDLKKRAYLAQYLVKVEVPLDIMGDADVATLYEQYEALIEEFKTVHKESEAVKNSGYSTTELRVDLEEMEREKDIVLKRIERMQKKIESMPNKESMLAAAHALRKERDREKELANQRQEQQVALAHTEQRAVRLQQQLKDMRRTAVGATPEALFQRLEEETNVSTYIVKQKLPKEIETRNQEVEILEKVLGESAMGRSDLDALNGKLQALNNEINQLVERHLATKNPTDDKLAPFRQQAAIIARKKETVTEQLKELQSTVNALDDELAEKQARLQELAGESVLSQEEFKRYVNKLRGRSCVYKRQRAELLALRAEAGVLARTLEVLQARSRAAVQGLSLIEEQHGVAGYHSTEQRLDEVSQEKASVDQEKGKTLEEMTTLVVQINQRIASKKAELAPLIKELRALREKHQELNEEYQQKKHAYDTTAAGLESTTSKLEQEVKALRGELMRNESQSHLLEAQCLVQQAKLDDLAAELRYYVSSSPADKSRSMRERLGQAISEQERLSRQLKEDQQQVKEGQHNRAHQVKLWTDLSMLLDCKKKCMEEARKSSGIVRREKGTETLILQ